MILTAFDVYLVGQLDTISSLLEPLSFFGAFFLFGAIGGSIACTADKDTPEKVTILIKKISKYICIIVPIIWILCMAVPSTKTAAAMIILPPMVNAVTQNKELQQLPPKLLGLANDWIDALKPEVKK